MGTIEAVYYIRTLEKGLVPAVTDVFDSFWTPRQDKKPVRTTAHTKT